MVVAVDVSIVLICIMNIVFAYGGQFAFVDVITSMQTPADFPSAISVSTLIMGAGYIGLGLVGYALIPLRSHCWDFQNPPACVMLPVHMVT